MAQRFHQLATLETAAGEREGPSEKATTIHCYPTEPLAALTEMRSRLGAGAAARCSEWLLLEARNGFGVGAK